MKTKRLSTSCLLLVAGLPGGKTVKIFIVAANDAGQAAPSDTKEVVVL